MIAFALRADFEGTVDLHGDGTTIVPRFSGGSLTYGDGRTFDLRAALEDEPTPGVIVVADDSELVNGLDGVGALKRVEVPKGAQAISGYSGLPTSTLKQIAKDRGLEGTGRASRAALEAALIAQDERLADGDETAETSPDNPATVDEIADGNTDPAGDAGQEG